MPYQVDDALLHAMSGTELSRVRTELRLLPPEAYQQKSDRVERRRHCYAIKCRSNSTCTVRRLHSQVIAIFRRRAAMRWYCYRVGDHLGVMVGWLRPKFQARPVLRIARHSFTTSHSDFECYGKRSKVLKGAADCKCGRPRRGRSPSTC